MTCIELQESLAENEKATGSQQRAHLKDCPQCAALVEELLVIACAAGELREAHDPSPRVWRTIQATLRQEGIIRPQHTRSLLPDFNGPWAWARWVLPVAATLLVTIGIVVRKHSSPVPPNPYTTVESSLSDSDLAVAGLNDDDLMQEVAQQPQALRDEYADNLRRVNQYIVDAKYSVATNPNDEEARRSLMEAYQEKAMLFELAMDRSLP